MSGNATTSSSTQTPALFEIGQPRDRATKMLSSSRRRHRQRPPGREGALRSIGRKLRRRYRPPSRAVEPPPAGTRQQASGARARAVRRVGPRRAPPASSRIRRMRDAHQSLLATRVRTYDLLAVADARSRGCAPDLFSLEMWGGATFDTVDAVPAGGSVGSSRRSCGSGFRTSSSRCCCARATPSGYTNYPDNVVRGVHQAERRRRHRRLPHLRLAELDREHAASRSRPCAATPTRSARRRSATRATSSIPRARSTSLELLRPAGERAGATWARTSWPSRTWPACASRAAAYALVKALRDEVGVPIHFHTHDTSGINAGERACARPTPASTSPTRRSRR